MSPALLPVYFFFLPCGCVGKKNAISILISQQICNVEIDLKSLPLEMSKQMLLSHRMIAPGLRCQTELKFLFSNVLHSLYMLIVCITFPTCRVLRFAKWERLLVYFGWFWFSFLHWFPFLAEEWATAAWPIIFICCLHMAFTKEAITTSDLSLIASAPLKAFVLT